jgi:DNA-binding XRE family transcriptional regulator
MATFDGRISDAAFVDRMTTLVVKFVDSRVYAVSLADLEGADASRVTAVSLGWDGYAVAIEQESGNRLEVPWDVILYHAEPRYPFYKHGEAAQAREKESDLTRSQIGARVRAERAERGWTLADLSARTGIKVPNLSRLEKGRHMPSLETLEKVADAMGLPVVALVVSKA